jgi:hypothetical protein
MPFRAVSRAEFIQTVVPVWNLEFPEDRRSPKEIEMLYGGMIDGGFEVYHLLEENGNTVAGVSVCDWNGQQPVQIASADYNIDPRAGQEVFSEVLELLDEIATKASLKKVGIWTNSMFPERCESLERNGYELIQTVPVTRLDIQAFDPTPFQVKVDSAFSDGLRLTTTGEMEEQGIDWIPLLHESTSEMIEDMPNPNLRLPTPLDKYREMVSDRQKFNRNLMFPVLDDGRIVAYSRVEAADCMPALARTGMSGTVRSHRRRGLVTALKVRTIELLKEQGYEWLQTDNDVTNPMYQLNLQLGFKDVWSWLDYERVL